MCQSRIIGQNKTCYFPDSVAKHRNPSEQQLKENVYTQCRYAMLICICRYASQLQIVY